MLTFLSPCHRCSVLRQLGCKDGKNWNSKYVISWYMWHKINTTLLSLSPTRCIRIHCFSPGRQSAICLFSLKLHIFVSKLLIDSFLDKPWKWNICRILKRMQVVAVGRFFFFFLTSLPDDVVQCYRTPWNIKLISLCCIHSATHSTALLILVYACVRKALMALFQV